MENHERSRKHRENVETVKATMLAEAELSEDNPIENTSPRLADSGSAGEY